MSMSVATSCSFAMCDPMVITGDAKQPVPYRLYTFHVHTYTCALVKTVKLFEDLSVIVCVGAAAWPRRVVHGG